MIWFDICLGRPYHFKFFWRPSSTRVAWSIRKYIDHLISKTIFSLQIYCIICLAYVWSKQNSYHFLKSVFIWSYSGPYSIRMRENMDWSNSKYGHFSRIVYYPAQHNDIYQYCWGNWRFMVNLLILGYKLL